MCAARQSRVLDVRILTSAKPPFVCRGLSSLSADRITPRNVRSGRVSCLERGFGGREPRIISGGLERGTRVQKISTTSCASMSGAVAFGNNGELPGGQLQEVSVGGGKELHGDAAVEDDEQLVSVGVVFPSRTVHPRCRSTCRRRRR